MSEAQAALLHRFRVTITCPRLHWRETLDVDAADAGEAQPAAIAVMTLPLTGQEIAFQVIELPAA